MPPLLPSGPCSQHFLWAFLSQREIFLRVCIALSTVQCCGSACRSPDTAPGCTGLQDACGVVHKSSPFSIYNGKPTVLVRCCAAELGRLSVGAGGWKQCLAVGLLPCWVSLVPRGANSFRVWKVKSWVVPPAQGALIKADLATARAHPTSAWPTRLSGGHGQQGSKDAPKLHFPHRPRGLPCISQ